MCGLSHVRACVCVCVSTRAHIKAVQMILASPMVNKATTDYIIKTQLRPWNTKNQRWRVSVGSSVVPIRVQEEEEYGKSQFSCAARTALKNRLLPWNNCNIRLIYSLPVLVSSSALPLVRYPVTAGCVSVVGASSCAHAMECTRTACSLGTLRSEKRVLSLVEVFSHWGSIWKACQLLLVEKGKPLNE